MAHSISSTSSSSCSGGCGPRTVVWDAGSGLIPLPVCIWIRVAWSFSTAYIGALAWAISLRMCSRTFRDWVIEPPRMVTSTSRTKALVSPRTAKARDLPLPRVAYQTA